MEKRASILELYIKDFRAIKEAQIKLDGITVVAGENGCGKSTISKLLYFLFEISKNYDDILKEEIKDKLWYIERNLIHLLQREVYDKGQEEYYDIDKLLHRYSYKEKGIFEIIEIIKEKYLKINDPKNDAWLYRLKRLIFDDFREYIDNSELDNDSIESARIFDILQDIMEKIYGNTQTKIKKRNKDLFNRKLKNIYIEELRNFSVKEYGVSIINDEDSRLEHFQTVTNAIYIDSPMIIEHPKYRYYRKDNFEIDKFSHWRDLNFYLKNKDKKQIEEIRDTKEDVEIQAIFSSKEILNGSISLDDEQDELIFYRNDGKNFKMLDCATGIKSIATLQILYNNGWLTKKTLLILDEPEAHLHPKWIVEYARLIVLLNKKIGLKFFISSHNPDMVSAIQDITDKEEQNDKLRFYFAEEQESYKYKFIDKGIDEEDIFESFNIAMDRINQYGGGDDE